ncbi:MAG TPA: cytochrome C oxidase subunit IV family protein [Chitinophagaceae bacterium]|nr:cytochrome C oxidase subunit IV family protein [Chitinophagaceae bacterium]
MEQHTTYTDVTHADTHGGGTKEVWRVTIILSVLTITELALGFWMMGMEENSFEKHLVKGIIVILMLAKAFYIVGYFMHLKHEIRNFIMTVCVPMGLFVWFIIAFLADGNSFKNLRNEYNPEYKQRTTQPSPLQKNEEQKEEKKGAQE